MFAPKNQEIEMGFRSSSTWTLHGFCMEQLVSQAETAEWLSLQVGLGSQEVRTFFFGAEWLGMMEWEFDAFNG